MSLVSRCMIMTHAADKDDMPIPFYFGSVYGLSNFTISIFNRRGPRLSLGESLSFNSGENRHKPITKKKKKSIFQSFSQFQLMLSSHPKLYTEIGKIQSVFRTCCIEYTRKTQRAGKYLKKCQNIYNQIDRQRIW